MGLERGGQTRGASSRHTLLCALTIALVAAALLGMCSAAFADTVFSDNFETALSGWTLTGSVDWHPGTPRNGTHSVQLRDDEEMERVISTAGYSGITVSFALAANSLDSSSENVRARWYDGSNWTTLKQIQGGDAENDNVLRTYTYALPVGANDNASFRLRFEINASSHSNDYGYVDDVLVTGQVMPDVSLFSDNFETALSGWTLTGSVDWYAGTPRNGTHSVQLKQTEEIERVISTAGYSGITVSFALAANSLDSSSENVRARWYDGSNWTTLKQIQGRSSENDGVLRIYTYALPVGANDNASFRLRFEINASSHNDDYGYVDDVLVTGHAMLRTLALTGAGSGSVEVDGTPQTLPWSGQFLNGTSVQIEAVPSAGWEFNGWSGDLQGRTNPATVTMSGDQDITVRFSRIRYTLSIDGVGNGSVRVDGDTESLPYSGQFDVGTVVQLEARPSSGWVFSSWSGDATGTDTSTSVTMDAAKSVTANFTRTMYTLSLDKVGSGTVKVNGATVSLPWSGQYTEGSFVLLEAKPDPGWSFSSWSGDASGSWTFVFFFMSRNRSVTANFSQLSYTLSLAKGGNGSIKVDGAEVALPYSAQFLSGTPVTIEAVPAAGWEFGSWSGDLTGSTAAAVVTMDGAKSATATFNQLSYTLSLDKVGNGSIKVNGAEVALPYSAQFLSGTEVMVRAVAQSGWEFGSWSGDASGSANPVSVTMDSAKSITATFNQLSYTLKLTKTGSGSVKVDGVEVALPYLGQFLSGTSVTIEAMSASGWEFGSWSGDLGGSDNPLVVTMDGAKSAAATFSQRSYTLSLAKVGNGSITVNGETVSLPYSGQFLSGADVTLEATPQSGWEFGSWSGDLTGSSNPVVVTMDGARSVTATFTQLSYTLSVAKVGNGSVKVNGATVSLPYSAQFLSGTAVTLEALAQSGWEFGSWSGDASGSTNPVSVTMDSAKAVTANFSQLSYTLSLIGTGNGSMKVDGETVSLPYSAQFLSGTEVTIEAVAEGIQQFVEWSGDATGSANPLTVTMDSDMHIAASFMCIEGPFPDVPCDYWAAEAIGAARNAGVLEGYPDGLYRPGWAVDRAAMAVYIARSIAGGDDQIPEPSAEEPKFPDVPADHWAYRAVQYAVAKGVVQGYADGRYLPNIVVDRGQMAVFIARAIADPTGEDGLAGYQPSADPTFPDVPTSMWCYKHVENLASQAIVLGYPEGTYRPLATVSRDQMAVYISRAFGLLD